MALTRYEAYGDQILEDDTTGRHLQAVPDPEKIDHEQPSVETQKHLGWAAGQANEYQNIVYRTINGKTFPVSVSVPGRRRKATPDVDYWGRPR